MHNRYESPGSAPTFNSQPPDDRNGRLVAIALAIALHIMVVALIIVVSRRDGGRQPPIAAAGPGGIGNVSGPADLPPMAEDPGTICRYTSVDDSAWAVQRHGSHRIELCPRSLILPPSPPIHRAVVTRTADGSAAVQTLPDQDAIVAARMQTAFASVTRGAGRTTVLLDTRP